MDTMDMDPTMCEARKLIEITAPGRFHRLTGCREAEEEF